MAHASRLPSSSTRMTPHLSRRTVCRLAGGLGLALITMRARGPRPVRASPVVTVTPPTILDIMECIAPITVEVTLSGLTPGVRYEVSGDIMEADAPEGEDDFCCTLDPQETRAGSQPLSTVMLTTQAMATDLGLLQGIGPASDEIASPARVALFARIWLRDLATDDRVGPWESPPLLAVPNPRLVWTPRTLPGRELMPPRRGSSFSSHDSIGLPVPPQACRP